VATLTGHQDEINAICWSPGGLLLGSCSDDTTAKIWSLGKKNVMIRAVFMFEQTGD
jgi:transducin (beta)-like 1